MWSTIPKYIIYIQGGKKNHISYVFRDSLKTYNINTGSFKSLNLNEDLGETSSWIPKQSLFNIYTLN